MWTRFRSSEASYTWRRLALGHVILLDILSSGQVLGYKWRLIHMMTENPSTAHCLPISCFTSERSFRVMNSFCDQLFVNCISFGGACDTSACNMAPAISCLCFKSFSSAYRGEAIISTDDETDERGVQLKSIRICCAKEPVLAHKGLNCMLTGFQMMNWWVQSSVCNILLLNCTRCKDLVWNIFSDLHIVGWQLHL